MSYSEEHYLFSSDPNEGAYNVSSDGSRFSVKFLLIPHYDLIKMLLVSDSNYWNVNYIIPVLIL